MSAVNAVALLAAAGGDYQISRSVRLRSSASAFFSRTQVAGTTPADTSNLKKTISFAVKRGSLGSAHHILTNAAGVGDRWQINFTSDQLVLFAQSASSTVLNLTSNAVFRDTSAWYFITIATDTTLATAADRVKVWVNGVQITLTGTTATLNSSNAAFFLVPGGGTWYTRIGNEYVNGVGTNQLDGYLTEFHVVDGQALTPSSFGETDVITGVWKPKKYGGTYGTNGFYLNFSDPSAATATAIGKDYSGNGNNWTPNNISVTSGVTYDSMLDVPTQWADGGNGRGNYCVLNPLRNPGGNGAISQGNLYVATLSGDGHYSGTIAVTSGKWYAEFTPTFLGTTSQIGLVDISKVAPTAYPNVTAFGWIYQSNGNKSNNNTTSAYGASWVANDVIGVAYDADAGTVTFYKNGTSQGQAYSGITGDIAFCCYDGSSSNYSEFAANFGQRPFAYTPPTGFKALNTQNLPAPSILRGDQYFNIALAAGASIKSAAEALFTGSELVWVKDRANANNHQLFDSVRGLSNVLQSNTAAAETTYSAPSGNSVGWVWLESATAGFDIVTTTMNASGSTTINHSLGVTPSFVITKNRNGTVAWNVYSTVLGTNQYLQLNATIAATTLSGFWGSPTSTQFTFGSPFANTGTYVAYLFAEVPGFSRFGSYTGNGSTDGPFVYCGFRPRFVLVKSSGDVGSWSLMDTSRLGYNANNSVLYPDLSSAEQGYLPADILSNGFKIRLVSTGTSFNSSGITYIFAAFAENPFKVSLAR